MDYNKNNLIFNRMIDKLNEIIINNNWIWNNWNMNIIHMEKITQIIWIRSYQYEQYKEYNGIHIIKWNINLFANSNYIYIYITY